jgi:tetratricopeptide (TPR) repeat protein
MPGKIKFAIVFLIVSLTGSLSYVYSDTLYTRYLTFWFVSVKKMHAVDALSQARIMRSRYDASLARTPKREEREALTLSFDQEYERYLSIMLRVFSPDERDPEKLSSDVNELRRTAGFYYLEKGDMLRGVSLVLSSIGKDVGREEEIPFMRAIGAMYDAHMYTDIIAELSWRKYNEKTDILFWHGASFYYLKNYREAVVFFHRCIDAGRNDDSVNYLLASSLSEMKLYTEAIVYARKALELSPKNREARALLVSLLNHEKQFKEAGKVSRAQR